MEVNIKSRDLGITTKLPCILDVLLDKPLRLPSVHGITGWIDAVMTFNEESELAGQVAADGLTHLEEHTDGQHNRHLDETIVCNDSKLDANGLHFNDHDDLNHVMEIGLPSTHERIINNDTKRHGNFDGVTMNGHAVEIEHGQNRPKVEGTLPGIERDHQPPIAICGMSFRLPSGLRTSQRLWDFLLDGGDARSKVPDTRYNVSAFHNPTGKPGTVITDHGYFLDDELDRLDTSFFTMARTELERLDPQQRLMLEVVRECFEDAGVTNWRGKRIGCYMGSLFEDWCEMFARETQNWGPYRITGFGDFALSNRVSYEMDLQGPSMTIRTACSASLVALHEACVAISRGDCESAVIGGANLIMTPGSTTSMTEQNVLSKDGSCNTFSANVNGYARGEAITAIYVKKLDDALRDGNSIRAVIRGTATNHDGKTPGLTVPSADAQEALMRRAYEVAGIREVSGTAFVECHGTGTPTGDPIETRAVGRVFGQSGVYIGSVKPNFGHTEGASGLVSVIKTVLALENSIIPPNIKCLPLNPAIAFKSLNLTVPVEPTPWPSHKLERASVNSFGVGGTNAHVIIDSATNYTTATGFQERTDKPQLLLFSANTRKSLAMIADDYAHFSPANPRLIRDIAYTLAHHREHLPHRTLAIARNGILGVPHAMVKSTQRPTLVMVFTGQGAQWPQMGRELLDSNHIFLNSIRALDLFLQKMSNHTPTWTLEEALRKPGKRSLVHSAMYAQPLCAAIQIALIDTLASLGVYPDAVVGHSSGEIVAAYAAGAMTAEEAIINAMHRGAVTNIQKKLGAMAALGLSCEDAQKYLRPNVTIACDNSPNSVTISGDVPQVETVIANVRREHPNVLARRLQVDKAYHSYHMAEVGEEYGKLIRDTLVEKKPRIPFFSSVTGDLLESASLDSLYWQRNLESPVLFKSAISKILQNAIGENAVFLEIGPHSALAAPLKQIYTSVSSTAPYVAAMTRNQDCVESFLTAVGKLWAHQFPINLRALLPTGSCLSDLPRYPWDHSESYWYESRLSKEYRTRKHPQHELLGSRMPETTDFEPSWRNLFHVDSCAWVRDHKVGEDVVFPFAGYMAMAGEAARQVDRADESYHLRHVVVNTALLINESKPTEMVTTLRKHRLTDSLDSHYWEFSITSHNGHTWTKHCTGEVTANVTRLDSIQATQAFPRKINVNRWFDGLRRAGLDLGAAFHNLENVSASTTSEQASATIINQRHNESEKYHLHPSVIDSALQLAGIASARGETRNLKNRLPTGCDSMSVLRSSQNFATLATTAFTRGSVFGDIRGACNGANVFSISGLKLSTIDDSDAMAPTDTHATARQEWGPDIDFMDVRAMIKPSIDRDIYTPTLDELTRLCILHANQCLTDSVVEKSHMQRYLQWISNQSKSLELPSLRSLDNKAILERIDYIVDCLTGTPASSASVALRSVCCNLNVMCSGECTSWEDIITSETATGLYDFMNGFDYASFVRTLAHSRPNLRVLEIGFRHDIPSNDIIDCLTSINEVNLYSTYTTTSKGFLSKEEVIARPPNMEYATLNLDDDPIEQGFEANSYDLIIARHTIHTNRVIYTSLGNIRKLLRPCGRLLLEELCPSSKWINYIFGTHPKWWCGLKDGRPDEPYLSKEGWQSALTTAGFSGKDGMILDSVEGAHLNAMTIATPSVEKKGMKSISLLCDDLSDDMGPILQQLENQGYDVVRCTIKDSPPPDRDIIAILDKEKPFFENIDAATFAAFQSFVRKLGNSRILWVTQLCQMHCQDPRYAQVIGTARTLRSELLVDFATCEIDNLESSATQAVQVLSKFLRTVESDGLKPDFEYAIHSGIIHVSRFYPFVASEELSISEPNDRAVLHVEVPGRLSTLHWAWRQGPPPPAPDEVEVEMYSVALNFRDVLVAMNIVQLPKRAIGLEGAGVVRRIGSQVKTLRVGDRVAMVERGVFSSLITTLEMLCVKLPDCLDINEASTMFFPYVTALHSLKTVGCLEKGQTVLIHSACGGVGLAALQICQWIEAEIYVTVGSEDKVQHIVNAFGIPRGRIFNSRDDTFVDGVMRETRGQGVDIVLNSLSGELLHASWKCVAPFGKMVEIGKRDLIGFGKLDMNPFLANRSYCCVDVDAFREKPIILHRALQSVLDLFEKGHIGPIRPTKVYDAALTCDAFRYMQRGQHIGRICVSIRDSSETRSLGSGILARRTSLELDEEASYLLVGGLGGLGRAISTWMVEHGARHLIYLSRNAGVACDDQLFVGELTSMGCQVQVMRGSVTNMEDVQQAVSEAARPLKGILQMSMVLRDENFSKMTVDQWNAAVAPKVQGTWNLHNATISAGSALNFFVLFGSLSGTIGQPGQANYASANTFLDAFTQYRNNLGLPATCIDIGAVGEVGYISENQGLLQKMTGTGFKALKEQEVLDALVIAMIPRRTAEYVSCDKDSRYVHTNNFVLGLASTMPLNSAANRSIWKSDRRMAVYHNSVEGGDDTVGGSNASLKSYIASAKADISLLKSPEAAAFFARETGKRLFGLLMKPEEDLNTSSSLVDLGMDSLVGIELVAWWKQAFGFNISVLDMLSKGTLEALGQHAADGLMKASQGGNAEA
ncbi:MAG: hypothetical protein Q9217_000116 [Psora testacea]